MNHLAVATNDGKVSIRQVENLTEYAKGSKTEKVNLDNQIKLIEGSRDSQEWIEEMRYSPDGSKLAVGSHDNAIYLYKTDMGGDYKRYAKCNKHSSYITCVDWSLDGEMLRSVCGAYELLFFSAQDGKQNTGGASATTGTEWADHHCKFGWRVDGIYPPGTDGTHVNSVTMTEDQNIIATGDDYGMINIYRNPCREGHLARGYRGHSEHVTRVAFAGPNGQIMVSTGGQDQTVIQWRQKK